MTGGAFDMRDLQPDFDRSMRDARKLADRVKTEKTIKEVLKALSEVFPGAASKYYQFMEYCRDDGDPCDAFRDMDEFPLLMGMDVYVGTGTQLSDVYDNPPKAEKLWAYMLARRGEQVYPNNSMFIVFRPSRSKSLWIMTNQTLPTRAFVPRITIPAPIGTTNMTIIRLENLILDLKE